MLILSENENCTATKAKVAKEEEHNDYHHETKDLIFSWVWSVLLKLPPHLLSTSTSK